MPPHPSMYVVDLDLRIITSPIIAHRAVMGLFFYAIHIFVWHSFRTLSTAHASRTHVKAPQTDFPVKHDNSSGHTHNSLSERPLRTKVTFRYKKHRKSMEDANQREDHPNQARTNSPPCSIQSGIATKARRATSKPRRHPSPCPKPWKEHRRHQVRFHGSYRSGHLSLQGLASIGLGSRPLGLGLGLAPDGEKAPLGSRLT